ncbi:hypothetical protein F0U60_12660 [Archangium minus]|uniref:Lipoprotein n=1 Tax=Archangium minus TaxID=83450 RepID=A0ABY9WQX9_9BACT|nr:hypothetical protein F0U60_12660 [Archangium minus]
MSEADMWSESGARITDARVLEELHRVLEEEGALIVEHRFYRGSSAPDRMIFSDFDELTTYLQERTKPGDSFYIWSYEAVCSNERVLKAGKIPDALGRVPEGGAY